jgi:hypothetical protein
MQSLPGGDAGLYFIDMLDHGVGMVDPFGRGLEVLFVEIDKPADQAKGKK